jgi:uncharacterized repeat protein (TIGR01451 family)
MQISTVRQAAIFKHQFALCLGAIACGLLFLASIVRSQQPQPSAPDYQLRLAGYAFDPLTARPTLPAEFNTERQTQPGPADTILQFTRALTRAERKRLQESYKLRLTEYIPNFAFLERVTPQTLTALATEPFFRASVAFDAAFKVSPGIGRLKFRTEQRQAMVGLLLRAILFADADPAPVAEALRNLNATQIKVIDARKSGGAPRIQFIVASKEAIPPIARLAQVRWIEEVPEAFEDNGNTAGTLQSGTPGNTPVWNQNIHGEGQIVGVIDRVINRDHCWFRDPVDNTPGAAHRKIVGFRNAEGNPAANHGTFVAGIVAGDDFNTPGATANRGNAWAARLTFGSRLDLDIYGGPSSLLDYLTAAAADGARIHTNSWHIEPDPQYEQASNDVDTFIWNNEDNLVLGSSGNVGEAIGPPGTAKNAICVSAAQVFPNQNNFGDGNNGPTPDGRRKPDLFAPGCNITSADFEDPCGTKLSGCATSWATPATAGAAALVRQYYTEGWYPTGIQQAADARTPTGALLKATLLNSTLDMSGIAGYPGSTAPMSNQEGWGLIRLNNTLFFSGGARNLRVWDVRHADGLGTGESQTRQVVVAGGAQPLRVTLVWADAPGAPGADNPVVNDLNLSVTSPDGTQTFLGNVFAGGVSATGGTADALNNVEMVLVNAPAAGIWTVTVNAPAVNVGSPGQGYALVVTADVSEADLAVSKTVTPTPAILGANLTYTVTVANTSPEPAFGITVNDLLPPQTSFVSCAVSGGVNGACGGAGNNRTVTFDSIAANTSATITFVTQVSCAVAEGVLVSNSASVASVSSDPDPSDNTSPAASTTTFNPAPTISCPADVTATTDLPGQMSAPVTYSAPIVMDNCPGTTTVCTPPSGSNFPLGTTAVSCTATDAGGKTAMCSFKVTVWDVCIEDDHSGDFLLFNSFTGEYMFKKCGPDSFTMSGKGKITRVGCTIRLEDDTRVVAAEIVRCPLGTGNTGSARIKRLPTGPAFVLDDSYILNNTCDCT